MHMVSVPPIIILTTKLLWPHSERAAIRTAFNVGENEVHELMPGHALIVDDRWEL